MNKKQISTLYKLTTDLSDREAVWSIISLWKTEPYGRDYFVLDAMGDSIASRLHCRNMAKYPCLVLMDFVEKPSKMLLHFMPFSTYNGALEACSDFHAAHMHADRRDTWVKAFDTADVEDLKRGFRDRWMRCHYHIGMLGRQLAISTTPISELYGMMEDEN